MRLATAVVQQPSISDHVLSDSRWHSWACYKYTGLSVQSVNKRAKLVVIVTEHSFVGDYWPGEVETQLNALYEEERKNSKKSSKKATHRPGKKVGKRGNPHDNMDEWLMGKLGDVVHGMKDDFIVVHLQECCSYCRQHMVTTEEGWVDFLEIWPSVLYLYQSRCKVWQASRLSLQQWIWWKLNAMLDTVACSKPICKGTYPYCACVLSRRLAILMHIKLNLQKLESRATSNDCQVTRPWRLIESVWKGVRCEQMSCRSSNCWYHPHPPAPIRTLKIKPLSKSKSKNGSKAKMPPQIPILQSTQDSYGVSLQSSTHMQTQQPTEYTLLPSPSLDDPMPPFFIDKQLCVPPNFESPSEVSLLPQPENGVPDLLATHSQHSLFPSPLDQLFRPSSVIEQSSLSCSSSAFITSEQGEDACRSLNRWQHPDPPSKAVYPTGRSFEGINLDNPGANTKNATTINKFQLCDLCYSKEKR